MFRKSLPLLEETGTIGKICHDWKKMTFMEKFGRPALAHKRAFPVFSSTSSYFHYRESLPDIPVISWKFLPVLVHTSSYGNHFHGSLYQLWKYTPFLPVLSRKFLPELVHTYWKYTPILVIISSLGSIHQYWKLFTGSMYHFW